MPRIIEGDFNMILNKKEKIIDYPLNNRRL